MVNTFLISRIKSYIENAEVPLGTSVSHWYVGITHSPKERFASHRLTGTENGQSWGAGTEANARDAETRILEEGLDGGDGVGRFLSMCMSLERPMIRSLLWLPFEGSLCR